jgi:hypothetical protein
MTDGVRHLILCGFAVVGAAAMIGCEPEQDALSGAIADAQAELSAIHAGGGRAAPEDLREEVYGRVISTLKSKQASGSESSKGAAGLVISEAQRGLSEIAAGRARGADSKVSYLMAQVASSLSVYRKQSGFADSLGAYDPAADIQNFQAQIDVNTREVETLSGEIASLEQEMSVKREQVGSKLDGARTSRAQASEVNGRLLVAGASERVALAEEAAAFQRAADLLDREGAMAEIEATEYEPKIESVRREIRLLRERRGALEAGIERARGSASRWGEQSDTARREAERAGRDVSEALQEIKSLYEDVLSVQFAAALEQLDGASSSASKARGDREAKQAADASIGHAEAGVRIEYAQAAARLAAFIDGVVRSPSPSGTGAMRSMGGSLRETSTEMFDAAGEAYQRAQDAYSGLRIKDEFTRGRLEQLGRRLEEVGAALRGEEMDTGDVDSFDADDSLDAGDGRDQGEG